MKKLILPEKYIPLSYIYLRNLTKWIKFSLKWSAKEKLITWRFSKWSLI